MIGWPVSSWWAVACLPIELSQQPMWPQVWHIRRWTHCMSSARHSSQPATSPGMSSNATASRCVHSAPARGDLGRLAARHPVGFDRRLFVAQVALGVERAHAAGASGGDGLAVGVVDDVADGEDALEVGAGGAGLGDDVAVLVGLDLALDDLRFRHVADRDEGVVGLDLLLLAGVDVAEADLLEFAALTGEELERLQRVAELDVVLFLRSLEHDLRGPELVAPGDDVQLAGELGDEDRVLHRRVAAADHDHLLVFEESPVADAASGDAAAAELHLAGDAEPFRLRPHRQDHGLGPVLLVAEEDLLDAAVGELDPVDVVADEAGPEALGLGAELGHHLRTHDPVRIARVVLDLGRVLQLPAPLETLENQRLEVCPRGVERCGVAGGPTADDDYVLDL